MHGSCSLRAMGSTLGARDFSSAVSGLCQVFIVTRAKRFSRGFACSWLRSTAEDVSAFGQHRKFPPHARKTSGTQGIWAPVQSKNYHSPQPILDLASNLHTYFSDLEEVPKSNIHVYIGRNYVIIIYVD